MTYSRAALVCRGVAETGRMVESAREVSDRCLPPTTGDVNGCCLDTSASDAAWILETKCSPEVTTSKMRP